ncbi:MAG TPA: hypothetical protein VFU88_07205 [Ktedonobacterales bacterium]|nr:hypothetical protein [Ktedonobacterales bacterium]
MFYARDQVAMDATRATRARPGNNTMHDPTSHDKQMPCPDGGALDVEDAFFGDHDVEYWVARDGRLVPADPDEVACIQAWEHERALAAVRARHLGRWRRSRVVRLFAGTVRRVRRTRLTTQPRSASEQQSWSIDSPVEVFFDDGVE